MDLRNFVSWFSLLKITQVFETMSGSEILEIKGADLEMRQDLLKILPPSSYRLINSNETEDEEGFFQLLIEKITLSPQEENQ
ncbi:MAG: hypothetical protein D6B25_09855 [Desulfobulbaceae bacterium]|nr:MAG: hypothetical protein D6B25_09855 [Desulfobulbaceae bacterium]